METIRTTTHIGSDGILRIETPVGVRNVDDDIVLVYSVASAINTREAWEALVNETYGILADDPIER